MQPLNVTVQSTSWFKVLATPPTNLLRAAFECDISVNNPVQSFGHTPNKVSFKCHFEDWAQIVLQKRQHITPKASPHEGG